MAILRNKTPKRTLAFPRLKTSGNLHKVKRARREFTQACICLAESVKMWSFVFLVVFIGVHFLGTYELKQLFSSISVNSGFRNSYRAANTSMSEEGCYLQVDISVSLLVHAPVKILVRDEILKITTLRNLQILPPLLNRAHKVMIYGRVGQPSHRAIYLALIYSQKSITIKENLVHQSRTRKPLKTSRWKKTGNVHPRPRHWCHPRGFRVSYVKHGMHTDK